MSTDTGRVAQVFVWKEGEAPDIPLAGRLLREVNPAAYRMVFGVPDALHLFSVEGEWPANPWLRAVRDIQSLPAPAGSTWTDSRQYDLAGWQGVDNATGERIFVVTAYRRPVPVQAEATRPTETSTPPDEAAAAAAEPDEGVTTAEQSEAPEPVEPVEPVEPLETLPRSIPVAEEMQPPAEPAAQVPYSPQYPTGPIDWPPSRPGAVEEGEPSYPYPESLLRTHPLAPASPPEAISGPLMEALKASLLDSFAPYYAGFGSRFLAGLIDLAFMAVFPLVALIVLSAVGSGGEPAGQGGTLWGMALIVVVTFIAYHAIQLLLWGQTLGKNLVRIRVVDARGGKPDAAQALLRVAGYFFSLGIGGYGFAMIALDPRRQALHDKLAETFVVPETVSQPVPAGLPGYPSSAEVRQPAQDEAARAGARSVGMASVGSVPPAVEGRVRGESRLASRAATALEEPPGLSESGFAPQSIGAAGGHPAPRTDLAPLSAAAGTGANGQRARSLFRTGLGEMEAGIEDTLYGFRVGEQAARRAAARFRAALDLVPSSVLYRYFYAVALRYAEGFEAAMPEFRLVLETDPGHFEARQQVTYRSYWHDAFAYPGWPPEPPAQAGDVLPDPMTRLLPAGQAAVTRLVLLREGGNKLVSLLCRAPRRVWSAGPAAGQHVGLSFVLSRTPYGPILAIYLVMRDGSSEPFIGEAFLNPQEGLAEGGDACLLGQHLLEQLTRQNGMYLVLTDEENHLLFSRRMGFDTSTQVSIIRVLYEVQALPAQVMDPGRLRQAADWHMEHYPLDQVQDQALPLV